MCVLQTHKPRRLPNQSRIPIRQKPPSRTSLKNILQILLKENLEFITSFSSYPSLVFMISFLFRVLVVSYPPPSSPHFIPDLCFHRFQPCSPQQHSIHIPNPSTLSFFFLHFSPTLIISQLPPLKLIPFFYFIKQKNPPAHPIFLKRNSRLFQLFYR